MLSLLLLSALLCKPVSHWCQNQHLCLGLGETLLVAPIFLTKPAKSYFSSTDLLEPWCSAQGSSVKEPCSFCRAILQDDKSKNGGMIPLEDLF